MPEDVRQDGSSHASSAPYLGFVEFSGGFADQGREFMPEDVRQDGNPLMHDSMLRLRRGQRRL